MSVYRKNYSKAEFNFSLPLLHVASDEVKIVFKPNGLTFELLIKNALFKKLLPAGADGNLQIDIEELAIASTGGADFTNYLSADKDRIKAQEGLSNIEVLTGATVDRTGALNIFRSGGKTDTDVICYTADLDFLYKLNPNKEYLIISTIISGANDAVESVLYGELMLSDSLTIE